MPIFRDSLFILHFVIKRQYYENSDWDWEYYQSESYLQERVENVMCNLNGQNPLFSDTAVIYLEFVGPLTI